MDDIDRMVAKEEEQAGDDLVAGIITKEEHRKELKYIYDNAQACLEERAQEAYDDVMGRW